MVIEDRNFEGVEVGVKLADLDSTCLGGLSEGEGSAVECYLSQHGLSPLVLGCIMYKLKQCSLVLRVME